MHWLTLPTLLAIILSGCYTPRQLEFESSMRSLISEDTSKVAAIESLSSAGFRCDGQTVFLGAKKGTVGCSRQRDNLFPPYACIERVEFVALGENSGITNINFGKIVCAGL